MDRNELADKLDGMASSTFFGPDKDAMRQAAAALRESEEWRRDAERYRWLRDPENYPDHDWWANVLSMCDDGQSFDAAIDAARKEGV